MAFSFSISFSPLPPPFLYFGGNAVVFSFSLFPFFFFPPFFFPPLIDARIYVALEFQLFLLPPLFLRVLLITPFSIFLFSPNKAKGKRREIYLGTSIEGRKRRDPVFSFSLAPLPPLSLARLSFPLPSFPSNDTGRRISADFSPLSIPSPFLHGELGRCTDSSFFPLPPEGRRVNLL